jgi:phosphonate metabolism protein (transferase hexapeptide repeat family)
MTRGLAEEPGRYLPLLDHEGERQEGALRPLIHATATVRGSKLGPFTEVGARSRVIGIHLGAYSCVGHDSQIIDTRIGRFCSIAPHASINPGNHPTSRAAMHRFVYRSRMYGLGEDDEALLEWQRSQPVELGHDVCIGHGAIILPGVRLGTGSIVGAGAVVTESVLPFTIVAGVPARLLRRRFDKATAEGLLKTAWWDWPHAQLKEALDDFRVLDAQAFVEKYRNSNGSKLRRAASIAAVADHPTGVSSNRHR